MPRIRIQPVQVNYRPNYLGEAVARAGEHIARGVREYGSLKAEEARAGSQLLREQRLTAEAEAEAQADEADRQAVVEGLERLGADHQRQAMKRGIQEAIASPGGAIGPYGFLTSKKFGEGIQKSLGVQERVAGYTELARRMHPAAARAYLEDKREEERRSAVADGYHQDLEVLQDAAASGKIAPEAAEQLGQLLQSAIREGRSPGEVQQKVVEHVELFEAQKRRAISWKEADSKAVGMLRALEQLSAFAEDPEVREKLNRKVVEGKAEWARTEDGPGGNPYRAKNDPQQSLGGLQEILFEARADKAGYAGHPQEIGDTQTEQAAGAEVRRLMTSPEARAAKFGEAPPPAPGRGARRPRPPQTAQDAPGAGQPPEALRPKRSIAREPDVKPGPEQGMRDFMKLRPDIARGFVVQLQLLLQGPASRTKARTAIEELARAWSVDLDTLDEKTVAALVGGEQ